MGICIVICIGMACMVYIYTCTWLVRIADVPGANFGCELCGTNAVAVGAIGQVLVAVRSVCAGIIFVGS